MIKLTKEQRNKAVSIAYRNDISVFKAAKIVMARVKRNYIRPITTGSVKRAEGYYVI